MIVNSEELVFSKLWSAFPVGKSYSGPDHPEIDDSGEVKKEIGGNVNAGWITNTCTIRLSRALNYYSGDEALKKKLKIPKHVKLKSSIVKSNTGYLETVSGTDGLRYAYRVRDMVCYLVDLFGPADQTVKSGSTYGVDPAGLSGSKGFIYFDVKVWSDATGHLDLWDGSASGSYIETTEVGPVNARTEITTSVKGLVRHHSYFGVASEVWLWACS